LRIAAIVCVRNEAVHIARCISDLLDDGIEVVLIDHSSEDRTVEIARQYLGRGLLAIEKLPWLGYFSLRQQLSRKKAIIDNLTHDWVLHVDADEWLRPANPELTLTEAIGQVDRAGFTCVNFEEMVFVPWSDEDFIGEDYSRQMTDYYFFEPVCERLMRAWRRDIDADIISGGGHLLFSTDLKVYPQNFINRHYIMLSREHGRYKYASRRFDALELAMGWHCNRVDICGSDLILKPSPHLRRLDRWDSANFDRSEPATTHFWEWPNSATASSSAMRRAVALSD
jgi:glycosyltransferase involved in cell wall biosynthesis